MQDNPAPRICSVEGCEAPLRATNTIGRCREHAYIPAAGDICAADGCDTLLRKDNRTGYCTPHKRAKSRGPVPKRDFSGRVFKPRTCPDCGTDFNPRSANDERCPDCQHTRRLALRAEREGRNQRDTCSVDGCDAKLRTSNTIGRCSEHRYIPVDSPVCAADGCEQPLRKDNGTGYCQAHKFATARAPVRICAADGCENELRADNQSGYCKAHAWQTATTRASREQYYAELRGQSAQRYLQRPECSVDGCTNRIRSDNTSGRCTDHLYIPLDLAVCSVDGCGNKLIARNTTGRCVEHFYWRADAAPECSEPGCGKTLYRNNGTGFCHEHRKAWRDAYNREYYQRTQAEQRESSRQWREANAEEHRAAASAWNAANRAARYAAQARRVLAANAGMDDFDRELSVAYRLAILHDPCWYCGSPVTDHVDHFYPLAKGGNDRWFGLVRACQRCNNAKYAQCGTAFLLRGRL
jgi:5-methylcytosine-specific restriction endonuclease McrA